MKVRNPETNQFMELYVKSMNDTPVGAEIDYNGTEVPDGWEEIEDEFGLIFEETLGSDVSTYSVPINFKYGIYQIYLDGMLPVNVMLSIENSKGTAEFTVIEVQGKNSVYSQTNMWTNESNSKGIPLTAYNNSSVSTQISKLEIKVSKDRIIANGVHQMFVSNDTCVQNQIVGKLSVADGYDMKTQHISFHGISALKAGTLIQIYRIA